MAMMKSDRLVMKKIEIGCAEFFVAPCGSLCREVFLGQRDPIYFLVSCFHFWKSKYGDIRVYMNGAADVTYGGFEEGSETWDQIQFNLKKHYNVQLPPLEVDVIHTLEFVE